MQDQEKRMLCFDQSVEGVIMRSPPYATVDPYPNYFHLAFLAKPKIKTALFIGAGAGIGPRAFHKHDPEMAIDVVDIDPKVLDLAHKYFHLEENPRIRTVAEDGRMFMRKAESKYDCVVLDAFSARCIPFHLVTREFLELCRDKMSEDGVFVMNVLGAIEGPSSEIFQSMYRTMDSVFPQTYVFGVGYRPSEKSTGRNIILLATRSKQRIPREEWLARAARYRSNSHVQGKELQQMVGDLVEDLPDLARAPLFSDDYAPIETMRF